MRGAGKPCINQAPRVDVHVDAILFVEGLRRQIFAEQALETLVFVHDQAGGGYAFGTVMGDVIPCRHVAAALLGDAEKFRVKNKWLRSRIDTMSLVLDERENAPLQRRHLGFWIDGRGAKRSCGRPHARAAGADENERDQHAPARIHRRAVQWRISNSPAAPMPPPMHMVTMPSFALRRRPSSRRCPVMRAPDAP